MKPLPDNTDKTAARLLETTVRETTGRWYGSAFHSTIADMAALGVAREEQHDEGGCDMHQAGKIARRGIADLPRSKGKVVQDPFPEAQALMKKTHKAATWFSASGAKQKELVALVDTRSMDAPKIRIKVDLNTTRVSARLNLIFTTLRMHKAIKMHSALYPGTRAAAPLALRIPTFRPSRRSRRSCARRPTSRFLCRRSASTSRRLAGRSR